MIDSLDIPRFKASSFDYSNSPTNIREVDGALRTQGIALVDLKISDPTSDFLLNLVLNLGKYQSHGPPISHSGSRGWFWDVRPTDEKGHKARSEGSSEFPWHTDCSYEACPPQYFGLHVLRADHMGGGTLSALNVLHLLQRLSTSANTSFIQPDYRIKVPPEFFKGIENIEGKLIATSEDQNNPRIRYRSDITQGLTAGAGKALGELNNLLAPDSKDEIQDIKVDLTPQDLPNNTIVLMDNGKWLHSRTNINDPRRHLRRIRWGRREF